MTPILEQGWLDGFKLRFSWGKIGLDNVDDFAYLAVYKKGHDFYEGNLWNSTLYEGGLVSQDLTWYTRNTINIGVDAEFFKRRLTLGFDYFIIVRQVIWPVLKINTRLLWVPGFLKLRQIRHIVEPVMS